MKQSIAILLLLTACHASVETSSKDSEDAGAGGSIITATMPEDAAVDVIEGEETPCEGDAMCWPDGYCELETITCQPQDASHCLIDAELVDCSAEGMKCCLNLKDGDPPTHCGYVGTCPNPV